MLKNITGLCALLVLFSGSLPAAGQSFMDSVQKGQEKFVQDANKSAQKRAEQYQQNANEFRQKLNDPKYTYCWGIKNENARFACLEEPWMTDNEDARKVLLGDCYGMSKSAQNNGLMQVCAYPGKSSCSSIKNSDISYSCYSCGGSRRWVATAAAGHIFQCF